MKKTPCTLPQVFRRIQEVNWISQTPEKHSPEEIVIKDCPLEKAQKLATPLGLNIAEGGSGATYLSWSRGISED